MSKYERIPTIPECYAFVSALRPALVNAFLSAFLLNKEGILWDSAVILTSEFRGIVFSISISRVNPNLILDESDIVPLDTSIRLWNFIKSLDEEDDL